MREKEATVSKTIGKSAVYHLLWTDDAQTLCGREWSGMNITDDANRVDLCGNCKRIARSEGGREYIDNLDEAFKE